MVAGVFSRRTIVALTSAFVVFVVVRVAFESLLRQGFSSDITFEAPAGELAAAEATRDMAKFWRTQAIEGGVYPFLHCPDGDHGLASTASGVLTPPPARNHRPDPLRFILVVYQNAVSTRFG